MAKFIKFTCVNTGAASPASPREDVLINVDRITKWVATGATGANAKTVVIYTDDDITGMKNVEITVSTSQSALTNPTIVSGQQNPLTEAIRKAITANPGGVVATVQLPKDQAASPAQMYWRAATWS